MPLRKGSAVISLVHHTDPARGTIRPGDTGRFVKLNSEDPRKDNVKWANFTAPLPTFRTQFYPANQPPPQLPAPYSIGGTVVYVGESQTFSSRTSLVSGGEGTVLGPSIDESDALITKPGTGGAALTLKKNHSVSVLFPQNQKAVNVRVTNLKPLKALKPPGTAPPREAAAATSTAPPGRYVNVAMTHHMTGQYANVDVTPAPANLPDTGSAVYSQITTLNVSERTSGPIHVRAEALYDSAPDSNDQATALPAAAGSLRCAYVGGGGSRACKHRNMEGSQQCAGHTCGAPGCVKPKSSGSRVCTSCAP